MICFINALQADKEAERMIAREAARAAAKSSSNGGGGGAAARRRSGSAEVVEGDAGSILHKVGGACCRDVNTFQNTLYAHCLQ
jgi:hypothetical protein